MDLDSKEQFKDVGSTTPESSSCSTVKDEIQVFHPWRRYFARTLDIFIYSIIWSIFLAIVFHVNLTLRGSLGKLFDLLMVLIIMLFIEPLLLRLFGTTIGKAVFSLKIENPNGGRFSYYEGLQRTWCVLGRGMGYSIPIYNLVCLFKSYKLCQDHEAQPWDTNISYVIKDTNWYRGLIFIGAYVAGIALLVTAIFAQQIPPNRGDLTMPEFVENYNYYAKFYEIDLGNQYLDETGKWAKAEFDGTVYLFNDLPEYHYTIENGYVIGVSFQVKQTNDLSWLSLYNEQMILLSLSMVGAQNEMGLFSNIPDRIIHGVNFIDGFDMTEAKIKMTCNTERSGYLETELDYLMPEDSDEETYLSIDFSINKLT